VGGDIVLDDNLQTLSVSRIFETAVEKNYMNNIIGTTLLFMTRCVHVPREDPFDTGAGGRVFPVMEKESMTLMWSPSVEFEKNEGRMGVMPRSDVQKLYLVESLGVGAHGYVWLACTAGAKAVCVIKFPHPKNHSEGKFGEIEESKAAEAEKEVWDKVYPTELSRKVSVQMWRGRNVLVMPHLSQSVDRTDAKVEAAVDSVLNLFVEANVKHTDIKWANLGFYTKESVGLVAVLFDLASTETFEAEEWAVEDKNTWREQSKKKLFGRE
jgi:hypothetical protein